VNEENKKDNYPLSRLGVPRVCRRDRPCVKRGGPGDAPVRISKDKRARGEKVGCRSRTGIEERAADGPKDIGFRFKDSGTLLQAYGGEQQWQTARRQKTNHGAVSAFHEGESRSRVEKEGGTQDVFGGGMELIKQKKNIGNIGLRNESCRKEKGALERDASKSGRIEIYGVRGTLQR